jgi:hypothetical protein
MCIASGSVLGRSLWAFISGVHVYHSLQFFCYGSHTQLASQLQNLKFETGVVKVFCDEPMQAVGCVPSPSAKESAH